MPRGIYDWAAIRGFYDAGHSVAECRRRFGFSNGAWCKAIKRGDIAPRLDGQRLPGRTRTEVGRLLASGTTQAEIARSLGLTMPAISHHARALGCLLYTSTLPTI